MWNKKEASTLVVGKLGQCQAFDCTGFEFRKTCEGAGDRCLWTRGEGCIAMPADLTPGVPDRPDSGPSAIGK